MTAAEHKSDFELRKDTPCASFGVCVCVCCEDIGENWSRYSGTALYCDISSNILNNVKTIFKIIDI